MRSLHLIAAWMIATFVSSSPALSQQFIGIWATEVANCGKKELLWNISQKRMGNNDMACEPSYSRRGVNHFHFGLRCFFSDRRKSPEVDYMGDVFVLTKDRIRIEFTEYRGATGADDIKLDLYRCN